MLECVTSLADAEPDPKTAYRGFKLSIKSDASPFIPHSDKHRNISVQQVQKKSTNLTLSSAPGSLRLSGNKLLSFVALEERGVFKSDSDP